MQNFITNRFEILSEWISANLGSSHAFMIACAIVALWALSGPVFGFSDTWQLVINTGTTICTFLMVFLLQNTGNRTIAELHERLRDVDLINREVLMELRAMRAERGEAPPRPAPSCARSPDAYPLPLQPRRGRVSAIPARLPAPAITTAAA
mgnify:CR=1 FL=1